jgi:hypothetical protein
VYVDHRIVHIHDGRKSELAGYGRGLVVEVVGEAEVVCRIVGVGLPSVGHLGQEQSAPDHQSSHQRVPYHSGGS